MARSKEEKALIKARRALSRKHDAAINVAFKEWYAAEKLKDKLRDKYTALCLSHPEFLVAGLRMNRLFIEEHLAGKQLTQTTK
jgi:hypothetical protein